MVLKENVADTMDIKIYNKGIPKQAIVTRKIFLKLRNGQSRFIGIIFRKRKLF
jgi:hypothetical protein